MATVTKPIALDESLNTTEQTPRNVADVLAQELARIAGRQASDVEYDNSVSGLSATDVQNAIDELSSEKVDKEVGKGLSTNDYTTAEKTKLAGIEAGAEVNPTSSAKTATESFETVDGGLLSKCQINLVPVQSGSGDPYPAGGGKNKFDQSVFSTDVGTTITYLTYATANGTYTMSTPDFPFEAVTCNVFFLAGAVSSGASTGDNGVAINKSITIEVTDGYYTVAYRSTYVINTNNPKDFNFQIEKGNQPTSFAPYSNVRPISGHTEVDLYNVGKNLYNGLSEIGSWVKQRCTTTFNGDGSITATNTQSGATWIGYIGTLGTTVNINNCPCSKGDSLIITSGNDTVCSNITVGEVDSSNILLKATAITSGTTYTVTEDNTTAIVLRYGLNLSDGASGTIYPMIRKSTETDSTFEPYLGHLYTVQIGSTVYGGYVDLVSGVMVATHAKVKLKDQNLVIGRTQDNLDYRLRIAISPATIMPKISGQTEKMAISDQLKSGNPWETYGTSQKKDYTISGDAGSNQLSAYCSTLQTLSDWTTFLTNNDVEACYLLATPFTVQLTPQQIETLSGQNNLSTPLSGQSIETNGVEYKELFTFADVKSYVDKKIPDAPTTDGTYTLQAVVSGGVPTYSWV